MAKIKIDSALYARAKNAAEIAGYSSLEEFVIHTVEKEVAKYEKTEINMQAPDQLRGLGYID